MADGGGDGGALGFSDDELTGTARDAWTVLVDGEALTVERAAALGPGMPTTFAWDVACGLPTAAAEDLTEWLEGLGVSFEVRADR